MALDLHQVSNWIAILLATPALAIWVFSWTLNLIALSYAIYLFRFKRGVGGAARTNGNRGDPEDPAPPLPGVSIIKPLVGADQNLPSNLETFFSMKYPGPYELLFCMPTAKDPAMAVCKEVAKRYPKVDVRYFIGGEKVGDNPKINNMHPGYVASKYELVMISDAGLSMREDTLEDMVRSMEDDVGLVHQMPFMCCRKGFPSLVEKLYFGTWQARGYLAFQLIGLNWVTGMSVVFRKKVVEGFGGLRALGCYLAEDYFLGEKIKKSGFKLRLAPQPAWQNPAPGTMAAFQARLRRWMQLGLAMLPLLVPFDALMQCMVLGVYSSYAVYALSGLNPLIFFTAHGLSWLFFDFCLITTINGKRIDCSPPMFAIAGIFREINSVVQMVMAYFSPVIRWRTGYYRLKWGGVISQVMPLTPKPSTAADRAAFVFNRATSVVDDIEIVPPAEQPCTKKKLQKSLTLGHRISIMLQGRSDPPLTTLESSPAPSRTTLRRMRTVN